MAEPRTDTPARLPEVVVSNVASGGPPSGVGGELRARAFRGLSLAGGLEPSQPPTDPLDSMIAMTVRVAAVREMAREPDRRQQIAKRVSRIRTPEEAVAYIKEVEAKLKQLNPT